MVILFTVVFLGIVSLVLDILNKRKAIIPVSIGGLLALFLSLFSSLLSDKMTFDEVEGVQSCSLSFLSCLSILSWEEQLVAFTGGVPMFTLDTYSIAFSALLVLLTAFVLSMTGYTCSYRKTLLADIPILILFLLSGAVAMVMASNFAMFFLGLEVLSISLYLLVSSKVKSHKSNEAGVKYFIMGAFASCITLFGIALIYGDTGSFVIGYDYGASSWWYTIGMALLLVGMLFKVSAFPFHFWAPDVYEGSPTVITSLMSTMVKVTAIATLYKLLATLLGGVVNTPFFAIIAVVAVATMTVGNITALWQTNIKRMLAYSGLSHAGFMLLSFLFLPDYNYVLFYYAVAYSLAGIAAFAVIISVCHEKSDEDLSHFKGLFKRAPWMAIILSGSLLSMAGIPIFAGFMAKFFLFSHLFAEGYIWLVVIGVLNSIVSVFYYLKVVNTMLESSSDQKTLSYPLSLWVVATVAFLLTVLGGVCPSLWSDIPF